jgi:hypothetical protein
VRRGERAAGCQNAHDVEIGEGDDQREQRRDGDDVAHHRQGHVPDALPPRGPVDRGRLVELLGHRLERRQVHDHEERSARPDVDQDDREARPSRLAQPRHGTDAEMRQDPVEGAVGRIEQPEPGQRTQRRRNHPRHQQHAAPLALALGRNVVHEMGDHEADQRLEDHGRDGEQARLEDHVPERLPLEEEFEIAEADELGHRLVERRQPDRIASGIRHQDQDQQDQRQGHQEGDGRLALHQLVKAGAAVAGQDDGVWCGDVCHGVLRAASAGASDTKRTPPPRRRPPIAGLVPSCA